MKTSYVGGRSAGVSASGIGVSELCNAREIEVNPPKAFPKPSGFGSAGLLPAGAEKSRGCTDGMWVGFWKTAGKANRQVCAGQTYANACYQQQHQCSWEMRFR